MKNVGNPKYPHDKKNLNLPSTAKQQKFQPQITVNSVKPPNKPRNEITLLKTRGKTRINQSETRLNQSETRLNQSETGFT